MQPLRIKLEDGAYAPEKAHASDAGFDLRSPVDVIVPERGQIEIELGVAMEIPAGCYGAIESRSGLAFHNGVTCHRGIIDSGYRGFVKALLFNHSDEAYHVHKGDKICQLIIHQYKDVLPMVVDEMTDTDRGFGGFGSSGK